MEEVENSNQSIKVEESEVMDIQLEKLHHSIDIKEEISIDESQIDEKFKCGYYFVLFNKDNSVAVVPCSWVIKIEENETYNCFWPGVTINSNMIRKCVLPKLNWECYNVTIKGRFDSYEAADQAIAEFFGEDIMGGYANFGRGRRESKKRKFSDDEDADGKKVCRLIAPKNKCTRLKTTDNGQLNQNGDHTSGKINVDADPLNTEKQDGEQIVAGEVEEKIEAQFPFSCYKKLFQELTHLKSLVHRTLSKVTLIEQKLENYEGKTKTYRFAHMTPLQSFKDLQTIEDSTKDLEGSKDELKIWFLSIGGVNPKDFIVRCLQRLFTNKLGINCSWMGRKDNYRLQDLKIMATMLAACRELFPNWTDKEYEMCVREWFNHCMQRYKRECPPQEDSQ